MVVNLTIELLEMVGEESISIEDVTIYLKDFFGQHEAEHEVNGHACSIAMAEDIKEVKE